MQNPLQTSRTFSIKSESDILDPALLAALADLAETRGDVAFTPGGGVLFKTPITPEERQNLPRPVENPITFLDLPSDRFHKAYREDADFSAFVDQMTVRHIQAGYRLVVISLAARLTPQQLRTIAEGAETFGQSVIRMTADVSIRLPNVPEALLHPLFKRLRAAGLAGPVAAPRSIAA